MPQANSPRFYTGPAVPTVYDPSWPSYNNLTAAQVAVFEAFPQDLIKYLSYIRWQYENRSFDSTLQVQPNPYISIGGVPIYFQPGNLTLITALAFDAQINPSDAPYNFTVNGTVYSLTAQQALGLFSGIRSYIQQCRDIEANMINGINDNTITQRSQIDTAFSVLV